MNKLSMPSDHMAEKAMTPEERQERQRQLSRWRMQNRPRAEETEK